MKIRSHSEVEALKIILSCAKQYKDNLLNKKFLYIFRNNKGKYGHIEVLFRPKHFMHLTGNERVDDKTAIHFFSMCIDNTLSVNDIIKTDMMDLKLTILPSLMRIHKNARMIGSFKGEPFRQLLTEKLVGHSKGCMGFVFDEEEDFLVPNTVLFGNTRDMILENNQVLAVYMTDIGSDMYDIICYVAKNSDIAKLNPGSLKWVNDICKLIHKKNLQIDI